MPGPSRVMDGCDMISNRRPFLWQNTTSPTLLWFFLWSGKICHHQEKATTAFCNKLYTFLLVCLYFVSQDTFCQGGFFVKGIYCYISFLTFSYIMNRYRDAIRKSLSPQNLFKCVLLYIESTMHIKSVDLHKLLTRLFSINLPISPYVFTLKNRIQTHLNVYTLAHFIK